MEALDPGQRQKSDENQLLAGVSGGSYWARVSTEILKGTHVVHPSYEQSNDHQCPDNNSTRGPNTIGENLRINIMRVCSTDGK